jgi:hypothetical protein
LAILRQEADDCGCAWSLSAQRGWCGLRSWRLPSQQAGLCAAQHRASLVGRERVNGRAARRSELVEEG